MTLDVDISYAQSNQVNLRDYDDAMSDSEENLDEKLDKINLLDFVIISEENKIYKMWKFLDVMACLISSYYYAYMAAFQNPMVGEPLFNVMLFFETIFFISMVLNFFVEFVKDGQTIPTRDLAQIANRYLRSSFINDFIPLIPLPYLIDIGGFEAHFYAIKVIRLVNGFRLLNVSEIINEI